MQTILDTAMGLLYKKCGMSTCTETVDSDTYTLFDEFLACTIVNSCTQVWELI